MYHIRKEIERPRKYCASVILPSTMNLIYLFQYVERISSDVISNLFNSILFANIINLSKPDILWVKCFFYSKQTCVQITEVKLYLTNIVNIEILI